MTFNNDLQENLKDPEFAVCFREAQIESAQELLRCGLINNLTVSSQSNLTNYSIWED